MYCIDCNIYFLDKFFEIFSLSPFISFWEQFRLSPRQTVSTISVSLLSSIIKMSLNLPAVPPTWLFRSIDRNKLIMCGYDYVGIIYFARTHLPTTIFFLSSRVTHICVLDRYPLNDICAVGFRTCQIIIFSYLYMYTGFGLLPTFSLLSIKDNYLIF